MPVRTRADRHNNPTAMTTDVARMGGLVLGTDYLVGDSFKAGNLTLYTAHFIGDPIALTIRAIDKAGFYTKTNVQRWAYIAIPQWLWLRLLPEDKIHVIADMYARETGTELKHLFT